MNTDKNITENANGWLAQELIPAISTVSTEERCTTKELLVRFRWIVALGLATIIAAIFGYYSIMSNPPYTVEIRDVASDGAVTYLPQRYEGWSKNGNIAAIRQHTLNRIYYSVYYHGLQYNFSRSGHVYATDANEYPGPFDFVREWDWSGDPHRFPYYNFSHTLHKGES